MHIPLLSLLPQQNEIKTEATIEQHNGEYICIDSFIGSWLIPYGQADEHLKECRIYLSFIEQSLGIKLPIEGHPVIFCLPTMSTAFILTPQPEKEVFALKAVVNSSLNLLKDKSQDECHEKAAKVIVSIFEEYGQLCVCFLCEESEFPCSLYMHSNSTATACLGYPKFL